MLAFAHSPNCEVPRHLVGFDFLVSVGGSGPTPGSGIGGVEPPVCRRYALYLGYFPRNAVRLDSLGNDRPFLQALLDDGVDPPRQRVDRLRAVCDDDERDPVLLGEVGCFCEFHCRLVTLLADATRRHTPLVPDEDFVHLVVVNRVTVLFYPLFELREVLNPPAARLAVMSPLVSFSESLDVARDFRRPLVRCHFPLAH